MSELHAMRVIARIRNDFPEKFGIPRQSGLVEDLRADIVFEPEYRNPDAVRDLTQFSHLWLIWCFSEAARPDFSPTVRPPRLGGNQRVSVFATRSPFRPNPIGLSSVRLAGVELFTPLGPVLHVLGADLMDGTPIYDIKPYLPYADCHPDARDGFAGEVKARSLKVNFPPQLLAMLPEDRQNAVCGVLAQDPRPGYQADPARVYGMDFAGFCIRFTVKEDQLTVQEVFPSDKGPSNTGAGNETR